MKNIALFLAVWIATGAASYPLLKRSITRPHRNMYSPAVIVRHEWTVFDRRADIALSLLGPFSLTEALIITAVDMIPETDPNEKASW